MNDAPKTKFYAFIQNNSYGRFEEDDLRGIGRLVWIEAENTRHANLRAETIGLYFDGVLKEIDCPCCGNRWDDAFEGDSTLNPLKTGWPQDEKAFIHPLNGKFFFFDTTKGHLLMS